MTLTRTLRYFSDAIKIEHTVFALPFAYVGMILAAGGWPGWRIALWVTLALLGARTTAMALNRLIDRFIDARNPRTAARHLPSGLLRPIDLGLGALLGAVLLFFAAWELNPLCLALAPLALVFLVGYAYTKRFTWASHWILGFTDGMAGAGGWIAVRGRFDPPALLLWFALTVWIAGFDLIYACQDVDFDRREGLYSIPARFSIPVALNLARICHFLTVLALAAIPFFVPLSWAYWLGLIAVVALFVYEHSLVSPADLSRVGVAFFNVNGYISLIVLAATLAGRLVPA
jgi:4-hydroxybenzoate polyprenyltransferase